MMSSNRSWMLLVAVAIGVLAGVAVLRSRSSNSPHPPGGVGGDAHPARRAGFRDVTDQSGIDFRMTFLTNEQGQTFKINLYDHGCGLAVGDYDGDGHDDIYFMNQLGANALFRNNGDGKFTDVTEQVGVALEDRICVGATFSDYDNDGDQDLFVTSTRGGNVLFRNEGSGVLKDATEEAGLTHVGHSQTAVFFDYDNDGYLDLYVVQTARWTTNTFDDQSRYFIGKGVEDFMTVIRSPKEYNILYHNNRNGTFTDVTAEAGIKGRGWSADVAVFDYNGDGKLDLYVTCMFGPDQLYRNEGGGAFTNVTEATLGPTSWGAVGAKAFDFNNDALLDLYVVDMHSDMWTGLDREHKSLDLAIKTEKQRFSTTFGPGGEGNSDSHELDTEMADMLQYRREEVLFGNTFFKRHADGRLSEVSGRTNLETFWPWGIATGDFDNDGFEDAFITSGMGYPFYYWRNYLMMNNGDETFTDRSKTFGIEPPAKGIYYDEQINDEPSVRSSRCAATGDFDGDGRLELVVNNFNGEPYYFHNEFPRRNYIAFRLRGTQSNRDAIGALVTLHIGDELMQRQVHAASGYLSHSSKTLHFGLGDRAKIDWADIRWPNGLTQRINGPAINQLHRITEPDSP